MAGVKDIIVKPIKPSVANEFVKKHHYSGKVVQNSQLHFGCFLNGILGGVMSFGPSLDKSKEKDLTVPILPFSKIDEMGASMYKGKAYKKNACLGQQQNGVIPDKDGGSTPTDTLHNIRGL